MSLLPDIESLNLISDEETDRNRESNVVMTRIKKQAVNEVHVEAESFIPGTHHIYIQTWGCSHNSSDSEYMAGILSKYGFKVTLQGSCGIKDKSTDEIILHGKQQPKLTSDQESKLNADLWILNSCTVKTPAEDHFRNMISEAQKNNKKVIVAGCVPQGQPKAPYLKGVSVIGVQQIDRVIEVVEETLKGNSVQLFGKKRESGKKIGGAKLNLPKIRKNRLIEILPINTGCLNACTYCKTKHARGELGSYSIQEIVERIDQAFEEGVVEVWMTSEDLGAYGRDIGTNLPEMLDQVVPRIPAGCMLRLGMTNPPYILEHIERVARLLTHPRVYSFLHVPVQSGSDNVLGEMRREYTRDDFCTVVDTLYRQIGKNHVTVATDIICGFPTETDKDFDMTFDLVNKYRFPVLFTNQFYPRPGTPAARMDRVASTMEVKKRTKRVHDLFHSYEPYTGRIGDEFNVLITEESSDGQYLVGHTKAYEQVLVPKDYSLMGKVARVRVTETSKHSMKSEVIDRLVRDVCEDTVPEEKKVTLTTRKSIISKNLISTDTVSKILGAVFILCVLWKMCTLWIDIL